MLFPPLKRDDQFSVNPSYNESENETSKPIAYVLANIFLGF